MLRSKSDDDTAVVDADPPLAKVAADPPLANTIKYEAIPKLLFVDMQQEDEGKVAAAVTKLACLLDRSNANRKVNVDEALSLGAIAIILLWMQKWHCYNRSIQFHGCCILARLTYSGDSATVPAAAAVSIIKSGGIETIMAVMITFPDDDDIQGKGCNAIGNAFYYHDTNPTIDKAMARFVHELNGIELVVQVMKKFQNIFLVQKMGCHVLQQLSRKQVLRDALKKGGAMGAVGEATGKHNDYSLESSAAAFFKNMFGNNA